MIDTKLEVIDRLRSGIRRLERTPLNDRPCSFVPSGFRQLDAMLPGGGLPLGCLIELLADEASGALTLALELARRAIEAKAAWAVIDVDGSLYPPAAAQRGLDMEKLIVIRTSPRYAVWAFGQLLRCPEVGASFWCGMGAGHRTDRARRPDYGLDNMAYRRLQLAVERGGGLGFILRPTVAVRKPCWAAVRLLVEPGPETQASPARTLRVTLWHVRGSSVRGAVSLDIDR